ncbi:MAG TPA: hypothetical protein VHW66_19015 [Stellaceae bacterium]|jgi:hypothetical protein|nr:hypothetical protein [Stellaceae bacterium]
MAVAYHVGAILESMEREGKPTTAEALLGLWRQTLLGMGRDPRIGLRIVDERGYHTITGQIHDFGSAVVLEADPETAPFEHDNAADLDIATIPLLRAA